MLPAVDVQTWAVKVLQGLGYQPTTGGVQALVGWQKAEGGNWQNDASFNPLNTTLSRPGARSINGVGVKAYRNWQEGIDATVQTLRSSDYGGIRHGLKTGNAGAVATAIGHSPWGTNAHLVGQTIADTTIRRLPNVVASPGGSSGSPLSSQISPQAVMSVAPQPQQAPQGSVPAPAVTPGPRMPDAYRQLDPGQGPAPAAAADLSSQPVAAAAGVGGGGTAAATPQSDRQLESILQDANKVDAAHVPYLWGGGHQSKQIRGSKVTPLDCSGAVSRVLGLDPRVAAQFEKWGKAGAGKHVTIYAKDTHVLLKINGHFWGTSLSNPQGGAGWIAAGYISKDYLSGFTVRHPPGL
jgi:hypothetical protein